MLVQPYPDPGTAEPGVDFVVIPGIWNENTPGRVKGSCAWVKPLEESAAGNVRVFLFVYQLEVDGSSLWDQLLNQSSALLSGLEEHRSVPTHGSLRQAYQDATAGIIFLGTPHLVTDTCAGWGISRSLMRASRRDIEKDNMDDSERKSIITTCQKFEGVYLDTPILSVYEQRETKASWHLRKVLLFKNSRVETEMASSIADSDNAFMS
ncbi:hypothetical protein CMQ_7510 [Grosmannia clavigera kw1407]|uniref:Uncharacterized protein n=1 Tax=Grosmannia clavigera (strain kw1407 / UAMH 11150) TaxID=655863 RepID=F0XPP6_GROCL|nr:uncharacterized protein CMQ_7510 [Grosmannia clavigera kw1407]EFX00508.1 hypothetical protein CMQ_7510 [Grosmannia clavigera kw1407]